MAFTTLTSCGCDTSSSATDSASSCRAESALCGSLGYRVASCTERSANPTTLSACSAWVCSRVVISDFSVVRRRTSSACLSACIALDSRTVVSSFASVSASMVSSLLPVWIMHGAASLSEEIKLWRIGSTMVEEREPMGCGPCWIRPLPAEASQVGNTFGVEDDPFLFEQLLLVSSRTDFALGVDNQLAADRWIWTVIT